ncbi:MAG: hypothetical protein JRH16_02160 [Deltaproteobacteria bacterium]|nr:hypothetical protein [Deltaproteobacteria bacterium]MBW2360536.1 hypothetical protein [Deltaproteobacteria bacterium]
MSSGADRLLFVLLGVAACAGCVLLFGYEYGRDQGIYATVAAAMARGGAPYLDAWDFKPPGIFVVYAAARGVFGPGMGAVRLLEMAVYASQLPAFMSLSRHWLGDPRPGVLAAFVAFYAQLQLEYWDTAQPESFAGAAVVWALVCAVRAEDAASAAVRLRACLAAGLLYAAAGLFKPHLGVGLAVSAWVICSAARRRGASPWAPLLACSAGAVLGLLACAAWLMAAGAGPATLETFAVFLPAYHALRFELARLPTFAVRAFFDAAFGYTALLPAGLLALALLPPLSTRERRSLGHLGGVLVLQLLGVAYQGRFYPYHFAASLTLLALPAGWGLWKVWLRARPAPLGVAAGLLALALLAWPAPEIPSYGAAGFWQRVGLRGRMLAGAVDPRAVNLLHTAGDVHYGANRRVADWLATRTDPDAPIYVWGFEPMLYEMAGRRPASRWIYNVPQRLEWSHRERARAELMQDLEGQPPAAVVLLRNDVRAGVTGSLRDSATELGSFGELSAWLADGYEKAFSIEDLEVYLRRD